MRLCERMMLIFTHKPYAEAIFDERYHKDVERKMREYSFTLQTLG